MSRTLWIALLGALLPLSAAAEPLLHSVAPGGGLRPIDAELRTIDAADGSTLSSVTMTLAGKLVVGARGLARHPLTGTLYALLKIAGQSSSELVTVDPATGVATDVGNTFDTFAAIAFLADGTLYGVTGDGGVVPETLYTLSLVDASSSEVIDLGNGTDGETLAFNPLDALLYHASGIGMPNQSASGEIFETIDPGTLAVTNIPLSGFDYEELTALTYANGGFYGGTLGDADVDIPRLVRVTTNGVVTFLGDMDHVSKGLVLIPPPPAVPALSGSMLGVLGLALGAAGFLRHPSSRR